MAEDNFFEKVYRVARLIPYGRVTSYGAIAKCIGAGRSARMVGWAMNASHGYDDVPAHRVVIEWGCYQASITLTVQTLCSSYWKVRV